MGGVGLVPAAIRFLCNDRSSLEDRDVGAQALAHLSESLVPREAIVDSQAAVDGLVALIERWDGADGGAMVRRATGSLDWCMLSVLPSCNHLHA